MGAQQIQRSRTPGLSRILPQDVQHSIDRFAASGTTRLAYSEEDNKGRSVAMEMMREVGLEVRIDAAGNILGRRDGGSHRLPIMFGSHIDTVRDGGRFDGVLGVAAGIECMRALNRSNYRTAHPLDLVIFANEEGQTFSALTGSRAMVGDLSDEELKIADAAGRPLSEAIRRIGGEPEKIASSVMRMGEAFAFLEVHIEQGGELSSLGISIGW